MADDRSQAEAVLIKDGVIDYVGSLREARRRAPKDTASVNLKGRTALPGFIESHTHPFAFGKALEQVDCRHCRSIDDIVAALRERAEATPEGEWVLGCTYDDMLLAERRHPTRQDLDRVSERHPILLMHISVHAAAVNTQALRIAGVTADTPDPGDGRLEREADGTPNGVLWEWAQKLFTRHLPAPTADDMRRQLRNASNQYIAAGVTSAVEAALGLAGGGTLEADAAALAAQEPWLPLRLGVAITHPLWQELKAGSGPGLEWGGDPQRSRPLAVKLFQDGSIQLGTAALREPYYRQSEDARHHLIWAQTELMSFVQEAHTAGWQVWTHANGDYAIDSVINAYATVGGNGTARRLRHRIEHCQLANDEQLDRIAQLGLGVSFFAAHVWQWGDRHRDVFIGPERASRMDPLRSAQRRGIRFGLHNDTPVTPIDPLLSISTAATRLTSSGEQLGEDETVSVRHALRAMTLDSAWLAHEENEKGSLEVGKLGDVVILGADPLEVSPDEIRRIPVEATLVGGTPVYLRQNGGGIYD
ncbi:amidohydrolase [Spiribacter halobius]|nr:amidohydrolase [Spiribacter halobius]UEX77976.1 amidohydrolase [Spiribacter halobius]